MLYKIFMETSHLEDSDRVGIIEAPNIGTALETLSIHLEQTWAGIPKQIDLEAQTSMAGRLVLKATDNLGETAEDVYLVEYAGTGIVSVQGEEWIRFFQ